MCALGGALHAMGSKRQTAAASPIAIYACQADTVQSLPAIHIQHTAFAAQSACIAYQQVIDMSHISYRFNDDVTHPT